MNDRTSEKHVCSHRHAFFLDNIVRMLFQSPKRIVGRYIEPGQTVIDIGCGPGFFTLAMAEMVGEEGRVIAVDLQREMLDKVRKKSRKAGLASRIELHQCGEDRLGLEDDLRADFILVFYVLHEVASPALLLTELKQLLKEKGRVLIVEPPFHVSKKKFKEFLAKARQAGFTLVDYPRQKGGRSVLLAVR